MFQLESPDANAATDRYFVYTLCVFVYWMWMWTSSFVLSNYVTKVFRFRFGFHYQFACILSVAMWTNRIIFMCCWLALITYEFSFECVEIEMKKKIVFGCVFCVVFCFVFFVALFQCTLQSQRLLPNEVWLTALGVWLKPNKMTLSLKVNTIFLLFFFLLCFDWLKLDSSRKYWMNYMCVWWKSLFFYTETCAY